MSDDLTRRDAIKLAAAATLAASVDVPDALAAQAGAAAKPAATFFTRAELALVDELSEMIIPTDDHSPGARAAKVAAYIDARLAEAFEEIDRTNWRQGLQLVEAMSKQANGRSFLESSPEQRLALLERMAAHESKPEKPEELFFGELDELRDELRSIAMTNRERHRVARRLHLAVRVIAQERRDVAEGRFDPGFVGRS